VEITFCLKHVRGNGRKKTGQGKGGVGGEKIALTLDRHTLEERGWGAEVELKKSE